MARVEKGAKGRGPAHEAGGSATPPGSGAGRRSAARRRSGAADLFDALAPVYEMLASPERISHECEAIAAVVLGIGGRSVLDVGCAAGFHAVDLARRGLGVTGIDSSPAMIREARARAEATFAEPSSPEGRSTEASFTEASSTEAPFATASLAPRFFERDLMQAPEVEGSPFDALLCLGNTIASVSGHRERDRVLRAFRRALRPGGILILQMRDLAVIPREGLMFPTRSIRREEREWIFLRRQDPVPGGIRLTATLLHRAAPGAEWEARVSSQIQTPTTTAEWRKSLSVAGFKRIRFPADLRGTPRRKGRSPDRIAFARA